MGKAINLIMKESVRNNDVNLFITNDGNFKVALECTDTQNGRGEIKSWEFGPTALDEVQSFYWYQKMVEMADKYDQYPHEIAPIIHQTEAEDIKEMCRKAIWSRFLN